MIDIVRTMARRRVSILWRLFTTTHHGSGLAPVEIVMHQPRMTVDTL
jgi:hypothetical protein